MVIQAAIVLLGILVPTAIIELFAWRRRKKLERWIHEEGERLARKNSSRTVG
jgi:hypothetical protein